jgi:CheY-like chemotaxis protein
MKILVFDDNETNRDAAKVQLKDHDLTVVGTYNEAQNQLMTSTFDVVLTDLLVPASDQQQSTPELVGEEMPVGIFIALLAATRGAKYTAVFTDSDHHSHPASACFDQFNDGESSPTPFTVEGCKTLLCNNGQWCWYFGPEDLSKPLEIDDFRRKDKVKAKNWGALLEYLLK